MSGWKKLCAYILTLALIVSGLYVGEPKQVQAAGAYLLKVADGESYLYANGDTVSLGRVSTNDQNYYWNLIQKDDGSYWIQNQGTGRYMAIENQTGKVELLDTVYDVWASCKWKLNQSGDTTIQSAWTSEYLSVSDGTLVYGAQQRTFRFVGDTQSGDSSEGTPLYEGGWAHNTIIPQPQEGSWNIGARMPYLRRSTYDATLGGGAEIVTSGQYDKNNIASQAEQQAYIRLPRSGAYAEWDMGTNADGITMRYTMPDSDNGMGRTGSLDVYVNGEKVKTIDLTSYYMWQYFDEPNPAVNPSGSPKDEPIVGATPCFAFDEVHFKLDRRLKSGDKIRIQSTGAGGLEYGIDFLEVEDVGGQIESDQNAYSVTDYGAIPNDGQDDLAAIQRCVEAANRDGKDVYFPAGTFHLSDMWRINASNMKIYGAGKWYTNLQFTSAESGHGGISGSKAQNVQFCDMYINSNLRSRYKENAVYKCFMDVWSGGSYIHDIWEEHFECGFWLADYNMGDGTDYSDGIVIENCRIRNNLADGVNFCQGTSNATVYNCSIRNNGDDGLAMWNNDWQVKDESNNVFCYNTIDFIWRAGGIAIYGGDGHKVYNNYIGETFMASGIHVNSQFPGYKFNNTNTGITFTNNIIVSSGTTSDSWHTDMAAIDITEPGGSVRNLTFYNTEVYNSQHDALRITGNPSGIVFHNLEVYGTGRDGQTTSGSDNGALLNVGDFSPTVTINGLEYAKIAYSGIIYGNRGNIRITDEKNLGNDYNYSVPSVMPRIPIGEDTTAPEETTVASTTAVVTTEPTTEVVTTPEITQVQTTETVTVEPTTENVIVEPITTSVTVAPTTTEQVVTDRITETAVPTDKPAETTKASGDVDYNNAEYLGDGARGGALADTYKAVIASGDITGIVNIQNYEDVTGIYIMIADANIGDFTVNGEKKDEKVQGAGAWINIDDLTKKDNEVIVYNQDGTVKGVLRVYNANGTEETNSTTKEDVATQPAETDTKDAPSFDVATTTAAVETTTKTQVPTYIIDPSISSPTGFTYAGADNLPYYFAWSAVEGADGYNVYVNNTLVQTVQGAGANLDANLFAVPSVYTVGVQTVKGNTASEITAVRFNSVTKEQTPTEVVEPTQAQTVEVPTTTESVEQTTPAVVQPTDEQTTTAVAQTTDEQTTTAVAQTTDEQITTTVAQPTDAQTTPSVAQPTDEQTTAIAQTTANETQTNIETTSAVPTRITDWPPRTVFVEKPGKTKVKKASKKNAAKKVKLTLKKIKDATGYQVSIYKTKKNAKKNKRALVKKFVKKATVTLKAKKLKNQKKLFARARAYKTVGGTKKYGSWSNVKKVKIR